MSDHRETPVHKTSSRLSPPPKVGGESGSTADEAFARSGKAGRGALYWITVLAFLVLGATAFAVFFLLPGWLPESVPEPTAAQDLDKSPVGGTERPSSAAPVTAIEPEVSDEPVPLPTPRPSRTEPPPSSRPTSSQPPTRPTNADPAEIAFAREMTDGLALLAQGSLSEAAPAFERALALRPGSPEALDGLARVEAEQQLLKIAEHQELAASHEEQERWGQAAAEYGAVLALDPTIRFAQEGQARAGGRHQLSERLEAHLAYPERLSSDQVLEDARSVLDEAKAIDRRGSVLSRQIERLTARIESAETPIRVVLLSDKRTEILVFRVGRLGIFERHELELRPGNYTVVGSRDGYRDVRLILKVEPGKADTELTIRCEEKI